MSEPLNDHEIEAAVERLDGWSYDGEALRKRYEFDAFMDAVAFINRVAARAERANHHPEIRNVYTTVELRLWTHSAGGVTDRDVELAGQCDAVAM